jgi:hypothetical protein
LDILNLKENMEVESEDKGNKVIIEVNRSEEEGIKVPEAGGKDRFTLLQKRPQEIPGLRQDRKSKGEENYNMVAVGKLRAWLRIYYNILGHSQLKREHILVIDNELNKLLNGEPKLPSYLEETIKKTQRNILEWKGRHSEL